eukprot:scaffold34294_cov35-Attheya_sp.AAC.1
MSRLWVVMKCGQAVAGTVWGTLELGIVVGACNAKGPGQLSSGLSRHTTVTRPTQESENTEGT